MNDRERLEMIDALLDELSDMAEDRVVLIEGLKDRAALGRLIGEQDTDNQHSYLAVITLQVRRSLQTGG